VFVLLFPAGLGDIQDWSHFWQSKAWSDVTAVANLLTKQNLAIEVSSAKAAEHFLLCIMPAAVCYTFSIWSMP
jgi:hypothetical protein